MELIFEKVNEHRYEAYFEVPGDFNLHVERVKKGTLEVYQRGVAEGEYDFAWSAGIGARKVIDYDFAAFVYPKWIKVVSSSEVVKAFVTCSNGEATQIGGSKYEFVDLGLPSGTKWATCNVGATKPEEFGLYFAWGETEGYEGITDDKKFSWTDYKLCNGSDTTLIKYNNNSSYGTVDNLTTLEQLDDAVYVSNKTCRIPTKADFEELTANTTSTWETLNGVNGRRFTSTNGNSIFVPAAGDCIDGSVYNVGSSGSLWSSSLGESDSSCAWSLFFYSDDVSVNYNSSRANGSSVRAVQNK